MPNHHHILTAALGLAVCWFSAAPVQARDASDYEAQELVDALVQRFSRVLQASPTRSSPAPATAVVLLEGKALHLASGLHHTATWRASNWWPSSVPCSSSSSSWASRVRT